LGPAAREAQDRDGRGSTGQSILRGWRLAGNRRQARWGWLVAVIISGGVLVTGATIVSALP
jgi:hypothetical protein